MSNDNYITLCVLLLCLREIIEIGMYTLCRLWPTPIRLWGSSIRVGSRNVVGVVYVNNELIESRRLGSESVAELTVHHLFLFCLSHFFPISLSIPLPSFPFFSISGSTTLLCILSNNLNAFLTFLEKFITIASNQIRWLVISQLHVFHKFMASFVFFSLIFRKKHRAFRRLLDLQSGLMRRLWMRRGLDLG